MAVASSPDITPRPSLSGPSRDMATPLASPQSERRNLEAASPVISAATPLPNSSSTAKGLPSALKPIGIINEQNTCFLNSTFQALSSTRPLISLLTSSPSSSLGPSISIPRPIFPPSLVPALQPDALEPPLYELLPVTRAFINNLHRAWKMKDAGGGTYGSGETSSGKCMSLRTVLREIARKYDQYDDYRQQDAHELLRHLLDSMEMEEKDVIKKLQPEQIAPRPIKKSGAGGRGRGPSRELAGISPMPSPLPSPAPSQPGSPVKQQFDPMARAVVGQPEEWREVPDNQKLVPFVDVLFGGSLASVVVCEKCKSVSHTYEGFLDISLSMKDEPRTRKRDKLKALFRPKASSSKPSPSDATTSDTELSDSEHAPKSTKDRRLSFDHDDRKSEGGPSRSSSIKGFGLKGKPSFSFGKKKKEDPSRPSSSSAASATSSPVGTHPIVPNGTDSERGSIAESTNSGVTSTTSAMGIPGSPVIYTSGGWKHVHGPGPTPAQAAYIHRILANQGGGSGAHADPVDPLAKLRAANNGEGLAVNSNGAHSSGTPGEYGLLDCLRQFTSVEVLEGENSFACKKCWRIKSGKYQGMGPALKEEDEGVEGHIDAHSSVYGSPVLSQRRATAPAISITTDGLSPSSSPVTTEDDRPSIRHPSITSNTAQIRAPSPLRRQIPDSSAVPEDAISISSSHNTHSAISADISSGADTELEPDADGQGDDTDGLSDTSEESDEGNIPLASDLPVGSRPKMPTRKQSTHFVHRRAFKRYLIAKAPEVLVFHLKRFRQTQKTSLTFTSFYDLKKVDDFVSFPEKLDIAPFLAPNRNNYKITQTPTGPRAPYMDWTSVDHGPESAPTWYQLYAVVVHLGTMIGGHYIAYTLVDPERMFQDGKKVVDAMRDLDINGGASGDGFADAGENGLEMPSVGDTRAGKRVWCYCSDTSIRLASVDEVLKSKAYLCFYEKVY